MAELQFITVRKNNVQKQPVTLEWWEGFEDVVAPYTQLTCGIDEYDPELEFEDCF